MIFCEKDFFSFVEVNFWVDKIEIGHTVPKEFEESFDFGFGPRIFFVDCDKSISIWFKISFKLKAIKGGYFGNWWTHEDQNGWEY